jgi:excisionase family DNA binding protein
MRTRRNVEPLGYTIKQACEASSLSRSSIYNHIRAGRLRATHVGGRTVVIGESLRELLGLDGEGDSQSSQAA